MFLRGPQKLKDIFSFAKFMRKSEIFPEKVCTKSQKFTFWLKESYSIVFEAYKISHNFPYKMVSERTRKLSCLSMESDGSCADETKQQTEKGELNAAALPLQYTSSAICTDNHNIRHKKSVKFRQKQSEFTQNEHYFVNEV
jgi:hypothetical protein